VAAATARFGRLDVAVNNAGGSPSVPAAAASPNLVAAVVRLNLLAPFFAAKGGQRPAFADAARPGTRP
jgi:NAD(P)-dependent dehydrogenase (short-subunit alcohol dehydrogenase family)